MTENVTARRDKPALTRSTTEIEMMGHNELPVKLNALEAEIIEGLNDVDRGQNAAIEGWLRIGRALNGARALFPGDREFGQWKADHVHPQVADAPTWDDEAAAMWAAADPDRFAAVREKHPGPRTVRGLHAKWLADEKAAKQAAAAEKAAAERATPKKSGGKAKAEPAPPKTRRIGPNVERVQKSVLASGEDGIDRDALIEAAGVTPNRRCTEAECKPLVSWQTLGRGIRSRRGVPLRTLRRLSGDISKGPLGCAEVRSNAAFRVRPLY